MISFLKRLHESDNCMKCQGNSNEDYAAFQSLYSMAKFAELKGYVWNLREHKESETGKDYIDYFTLDKITELGLSIAK